VHAERHLVEVDLVDRATSAVVIGAAAALEALDHLAVTGGHDEALAAGRDLGVAAVELQRGLAAVALGALDPGLGGQEVGTRGTRRRVASRPDSRADAAIMVASRSMASPRTRWVSSRARSSRARSSVRSRSDRTRSRRNLKDGWSTNGLIVRSASDLSGWTPVVS
jgi:hypothetical protein